MKPPRCSRTVQWWGLDMVARCLKRVDHGGNHFDGVWFFDENGLRVDGTRHDFEPAGRPGRPPRVRELANA